LDDPGTRILDQGSRVQTQDSRSRIQDPGSWIQVRDQGSWIQDPWSWTRWSRIRAPGSGSLLHGDCLPRAARRTTCHPPPAAIVKLPDWGGPPEVPTFSCWLRPPPPPPTRPSISAWRPPLVRFFVGWGDGGSQGMPKICKMFWPSSMDRSNPSYNQAALWPCSWTPCTLSLTMWCCIGRSKIETGAAWAPEPEATTPQAPQPGDWQGGWAARVSTLNLPEEFACREKKMWFATCVSLCNKCMSCDC